MSANSTFANAATPCGGGVTRRKTMIGRSRSMSSSRFYTPCAFAAQRVCHFDVERMTEADLGDLLSIVVTSSAPTDEGFITLSSTTAATAMR